MKTYTEAEVIEMLRKQQGKTNQKEYAKKIGVSPQYLSDVFGERRSPGPLVLKFLKLEKVFRSIAPKRKAAAKEKPVEA